MVYESDFYTTRRPYSSRPTISSYSVTMPRYTEISRGYNIHTIPYVAHKRLVTSAPPIHTVRVRPSVIMAEIDRINYKVRPSLAYQPVEDYLNSRSSVEFDDERRLIRAHTAALLRKIHEPLPRARKAFPVIITSYDLPIPERISSDTYIQRLLGSTKSVQQDIVNRSYYSDAAKRALGGRSFPRRRNLTHEPTSVKDDVTFLSHYERTREAANQLPSEAEAAGPVEQEQA